VLQTLYDCGADSKKYDAILMMSVEMKMMVILVLR